MIKKIIKERKKNQLIDKNNFKSTIKNCRNYYHCTDKNLKKKKFFVCRFKKAEVLFIFLFQLLFFYNFSTTKYWNLAKPPMMTGGGWLRTVPTNTEEPTGCGSLYMGCWKSSDFHDSPTLLQ